MHTELQRSRRLPLLSDRSDELVWGHIGGVNIPPSDSTAWYEPSLVTTDTEWGPDEHTHTHHTHTHTPHTHTDTHTLNSPEMENWRFSSAIPQSQCSLNC